MFSKAVFVSALVATFVDNVVASPIEPVLVRANNARASIQAVVLKPSPPVGHNDFAGGRNPGLSQQDNFYWTHEDQGLLANLTFTTADRFRLLNSHNFADMVQSVDCSNSKALKLKFNNADSMKAAKNSWAWVNKDKANGVVYVVDGDSCGGPHGRQPWHVTSVTYDDKATTATLAASAAQWQDFIGDASVHIHGSDKVNKRAIHKSVAINIGHDFKTHIFDTKVGPARIDLDCTDCSTHGTLDADITVSMSHGFQASATAQNDLGVRLGVTLKASASLTSALASKSIRIATVGLPGFTIGGVVEIGPELTLDAQLAITKMSGQVSTTFGAAMTIPNGQSVSIGKGSTNISPNFSRIGPSVSANINAGAKVNPLITLNMSGRFMGKGVTGGVALAAPVLSVGVGAQVSSNHAACGGSSSVSYSVDLGVEVAAFAGLGSPGEEPHKKVLYTKSTNLVNQCVALTH